VRDPRLLVVALGGGALGEPGGLATPARWGPALERALLPVAGLAAAGFRVVLTHGSRPRSGDPFPGLAPAGPGARSLALDLRGAAVQGALGYAMEQVLGSLCRRRGVEVPVAAIVTRVVVDADDPAFERPTEPIGPLYLAAQARRLRKDKGWTFADAKGKRFRRVLPVPRPLRVLEAEAVRRLSETGILPIACGGGGVPVIDTAAGYRGVEAMVEGDHAAERLATALGATRLLFLTGVDQVAVAHGTPQAVGIERLMAPEARALLAAGEFPPGSMGPKVEAALRFVEEGGGREAIITSPDHAQAAIDGNGGTYIVAPGA
jgi:carbamate kinase